MKRFRRDQSGDAGKRLISFMSTPKFKWANCMQIGDSPEQGEGLEESMQENGQHRREVNLDNAAESGTQRSCKQSVGDQP